MGKKKTANFNGPVYGVPWLEVEFGQRELGWKLFTDLETCKRKTKEDSKNGPGDGFYVGPVRPLFYCEIPTDGLEKEYIRKLQNEGFCWTTDRWEPKYKSEEKYIE